MTFAIIVILYCQAVFTITQNVTLDNISIELSSPLDSPSHAMTRLCNVQTTVAENDSGGSVSTTYKPTSKQSADNSNSVSVSCIFCLMSANIKFSVVHLLLFQYWKRHQPNGYNFNNHTVYCHIFGRIFF